MISAVVVIAAVVLVVATVVVLARQRSVGRLSDEHGRSGPGDHVVGRPAGPDAEAMTDRTIRRPRPDA
jgi:hypothetical protein